MICLGADLNTMGKGGSEKGDFKFTSSDRDFRKTRTCSFETIGYKNKIEYFSILFVLKNAYLRRLENRFVFCELLAFKLIFLSIS